MQPIITFNDVHFSYNDHHILKGSTFSLNKGQMGIFIGENESGKSTIFKLIVGLIKPDEGEILINGKDIVQFKEEELYEIRKEMGIIFQESALFDSLTVEENVAYPLVERLVLDEVDIESRVQEVLRLVELEATEKKYPSELSGGMKKRVSIARALSPFPALLLYDDPAAGLDPMTARTIMKVIIKLRDMRGITSLVISNQFEETLLLAMLKAEQKGNQVVYNSIEGGNPDCIFFLLEQGKISFSGTFCDLQKSTSSYIQEFLLQE
ncbi:MAG: hypothetical protein A2Y62_17090 [Candidatus Fischerbacteria bacterium RBG_13_37_8]|uniref:ABC transporter domain-containing protein n=1 Tax=Candidatus Fischerbacteria bacterium RBG_13_37_8 TaxID=1817863 RepID=A0A1F5VG21_9BACT|nr:MAG: hypothetical protein A2Y62_17090 [Candidatus Fischerbacteria bacterium RBG_13_37_8]